MPGKITSISPWLTLMISLSSKTTPVGKAKSKGGCSCIQPALGSGVPGLGFRRRLFFWVGNSLPDWQLSCGAPTVPAPIPKIARGERSSNLRKKSPELDAGAFSLRETRPARREPRSRPHVLFARVPALLLPP